MKKIMVWVFVALMGATLSGCCGWGWYCGGHHDDRGGGGWDHDHGGDRGPDGHY